LVPLRVEIKNVLGTPLEEHWSDVSTVKPIRTAALLNVTFKEGFVEVYCESACLKPMYNSTGYLFGNDDIITNDEYLAPRKHAVEFHSLGIAYGREY
jgi:hypothetical protein